MKGAKKPIARAGYVNFLRVAHQRSEFFLQFGLVLKQRAPRALLVSSLVTSPAHAKSMHRALGEAVARYEQRFGEIAVGETTAAGDAPKRPRGGKTRAAHKDRDRESA